MSNLSTPKKMLFGLQHFFAMFGATVLVARLTGLDVSTTLLFAGIGTLFFHLVTKGEVPAFLGSSFAYLGGYAAIAPLIDGKPNTEMLPYACFGVATSTILYFILAAAIKAYGTKRVMKLFPAVVTGPIIMAIGLSLAKSAVENCFTDWVIALIAILLVIICNQFGKGMIKVIPIMIGVFGSYIIAALLGKVDFTPVAEASWFGLPIHYENTVFSIFTSGNLSTALLITAVITILPSAIATEVEHVGDIAAISKTIGKDLISKPGLHRTLIGDGGATLIASLFGGPSNTTYGENTGVLNLTKVFDPVVIRIAAIFAVIFSFSPKFAAIISCMPTATVGGVSLVLYGMISAVGLRNLVDSKTDFSNGRNQIIAAMILGLSIGITYCAQGAIVFNIGSMVISLSGLAVASIVGIVLNLVLPKKKESDDTEDLNGSNPITISSYDDKEK